MRALIFGLCTALMIGCSRAPTASDATTHLNSKVLPKGEAAIQKFYRPAGKLVWGPVENLAVFSDGHVLGAPVSSKDGTQLWREAKVGNLIYRVSADYLSSSPRSVTVSVRDGVDYPSDKPQGEIAKVFGVDPGLVAAFEKANGFARFGGEYFSIDAEGYGSTQQTCLACTFAFKP